MWRGKSLYLRIERRTETVTRVRFNVGVFGSTGIPRLVGRQIIEELKTEKAFLLDWASE
jgi:hypothetical protein